MDNIRMGYAQGYGEPMLPIIKSLSVAKVYAVVSGYPGEFLDFTDIRERMERYINDNTDNNIQNLTLYDFAASQENSFEMLREGIGKFLCAFVDYLNEVKDALEYYSETDGEGYIGIWTHALNPLTLNFYEAQEIKRAYNSPIDLPDKINTALAPFTTTEEKPTFLFPNVGIYI